jgi:hypothetical protein
MVTKETLQKIKNEYHKNTDQDAEIKSVARRILNKIDNESVLAAEAGHSHVYRNLGVFASDEEMSSPMWGRIVEYVISGLMTERQLTVNIDPESMNGDAIDIVW